MAATKRKPVRTPAKKAKKTATRTVKKPALKSATVRKKTKLSSAPKKSSSSSASLKGSRIPAVTNVSKPFTKGQLFLTLAGRTGLQRKDISALFDELKSIIAVHVKKQGPGQFTIPGLVKLTVVNKPATKARKGINPFTGEEMMFKAKPARNVVKARALKQLKELV